MKEILGVVVHDLIIIYAYIFWVWMWPRAFRHLLSYEKKRAWLLKDLEHNRDKEREIETDIAIVDLRRQNARR